MFDFTRVKLTIPPKRSNGAGRKVKGRCRLISKPFRSPPLVFDCWVTVKMVDGVLPLDSSESGRPVSENGIVEAALWM